MNDLVTVESRSGLQAMGMSSHGDGASFVPQHLGDIVSFAQLMAKADVAIPKHLRNNPGACMAVAMRSFSWGMDPFAVSTKTYLVQDQIAYEAQLVAAVVHIRAPIKRRPDYEYKGDGETRQCIVKVEMLDGTTKEYISPKKGDIKVQNSPLWKSDPDQQLGYYSIRAWARRHTPEVIMGVYTPDEMVDHLREREGAATSFEAMERLAIEAPVAEAAKEAPPQSAKAAVSPAAEPASPASDAGTETAAGSEPTGGSTGPKKTSPPQERGEPSQTPQETSSPAEATTEAPEPAPPPTEPPAPPAGAFEDFAASVAQSRDWPEINLAHATLRKSPAWSAADADTKAASWRICFVRLKELTDGGYRFDFITDMYAWRAYIEYETDQNSMLGNRKGVHNTAGWRELTTEAKIALDRVFDNRMLALKGAAQKEAFA